MARHDERIPMPPEDTWTLEQRQAVIEIAAGPRGGLIGPFRPMLHSPGLLERMQRTGEFIRWHSDMADPLREMVILMVARHWDQEFEWRYHRPIAETVGLPLPTIESLAHGVQPKDLDRSAKAVWSLTDQVLRTGTATDSCVHEAIEALGRTQVVECVATIGYYTNLAFIMNVANTEPPEGPGLPERRDDR